MLETCTWHNIDGTTTYDLNSVVAPLTDFDISVIQRIDKTRKKPQQPGLNPTYTYRDQMEIHCEGDLFQDDSASYVTERLALVSALFGSPDAVISDRSMGWLEVGFAGQAENWRADCTIEAFSAPVLALYPALTKYLVTFISWAPYFIGVTTPTNKYYWS